MWSYDTHRTATAAQWYKFTQKMRKHGDTKYLVQSFHNVTENKM